MFVEQNQEQVTEETSSTLENNNSEEVSVDNASDSQDQNMVEIKDYLACKKVQEKCLQQVHLAYLFLLGIEKLQFPRKK